DRRQLHELGSCTHDRDDLHVDTSAGLPGVLPPGARPSPPGAAGMTESAGAPPRRIAATAGASIQAAIAIEAIENRFVVMALAANAMNPSVGAKRSARRLATKRSATPIATASASAANTPDSLATYSSELCGVTMSAGSPGIWYCGR